MPHSAYMVTRAANDATSESAWAADQVAAIDAATTLTGLAGVIGLDEDILAKLAEKEALLVTPVVDAILGAYRGAAHAGQPVQVVWRRGNGQHVKVSGARRPRPEDESAQSVTIVVETPSFDDGEE